jgi:quercetin dioxygenase-like cupin family protein
MIKAYKIYTGTDRHTHIISGAVSEDQLFDAQTIRFKETPPHSTYDWHTAPETQYVLMLTGTLEFETFLGETFVIRPGEVLIAMDVTGSGHKWKLIDDQPWKRAYVAFDQNKEINFVEDKQ